MAAPETVRLIRDVMGQIQSGEILGDLIAPSRISGMPFDVPLGINTLGGPTGDSIIDNASEAIAAEEETKTKEPEEKKGKQKKKKLDPDQVLRGLSSDPCEAAFQVLLGLAQNPNHAGLKRKLVGLMRHLSNMAQQNGLRTQGQALVPHINKFNGSAATTEQAIRDAWRALDDVCGGLEGKGKVKIGWRQMKQEEHTTTGLWSHRLKETVDKSGGLTAPTGPVMPGGRVKPFANIIREHVPVPGHHPTPVMADRAFQELVDSLPLNKMSRAAGHRKAQHASEYKTKLSQLESSTLNQLKHPGIRKDYHAKHKRAQDLAAENGMAPPIPRVSSHHDLPARVKALSRTEAHLVAEKARNVKHTKTARSQLQAQRKLNQKAVSEVKKLTKNGKSSSKKVAAAEKRLDKATPKNRAGLQKTLQRATTDHARIVKDLERAGKVKTQSATKDANIQRTIGALKEQASTIKGRQKAVKHDLKETRKDVHRPIGEVVRSSETRRRASMPHAQLHAHRQFRHLGEEIDATEMQQARDKHKLEVGDIPRFEGPQTKRKKGSKPDPPRPHEPKRAELSEATKQRHRRESRAAAPQHTMDEPAIPEEIVRDTLPATGAKTHAQWGAIVKKLKAELKEADKPHHEPVSKSINITSGEAKKIASALGHVNKTGLMDFSSAMQLHRALGLKLTGEVVGVQMPKTGKPVGMSTALEDKLKQLYRLVESGTATTIPENKLFWALEAIGGQKYERMAHERRYDAAGRKAKKAKQPQLVARIKEDLVTAERSKAKQKKKRGIDVKSKRIRRARSVSPPKVARPRDESPERRKERKRDSSPRTARDRGRAERRSPSPKARPASVPPKKRVTWGRADIRPILRYGMAKRKFGKNKTVKAGRGKINVGGKGPRDIF